MWTKERFKASQEELGMTNMAIAELLQVSPNTVAAWRKSGWDLRKPIPFKYWALLDKIFKDPAQ